MKNLLKSTSLLLLAMSFSMFTLSCTKDTVDVKGTTSPSPLPTNDIKHPTSGDDQPYVIILQEFNENGYDEIDEVYMEPLPANQIQDLNFSSEISMEFEPAFNSNGERIGVKLRGKGESVDDIGNPIEVFFLLVINKANGKQYGAMALKSPKNYYTRLQQYTSEIDLDAYVSDVLTTGFYSTNTRGLLGGKGIASTMWGEVYDNNLKVHDLLLKNDNDFPQSANGIVSFQSYVVQ